MISYMGCGPPAVHYGRNGSAGKKLQPMVLRIHEREFERRYHFSSLKYFKRELGLSQKKEPEEEDMLRDNVKKYYLEQDYNCEYDDLKGIDDKYGIGLTENHFKTGQYTFGGGMGCGCYNY